MSDNKVHVYSLAMTCDGCANAAKRVLGKLGDAVSNVDIDVPGKIVKVTTSLGKDEILETLKKTGKECTYIETV